MINIGRNAIPESPHLDMIITDELISRAKSLGACEEGVNAARKILGQPIRNLERGYANWSMRLYDGLSIRENGTRFWFFNGELHREDGPAVEYADGRRYWYLNGLLHREDGPAFELANGSREWYVNGLPHRLDGPAGEYHDGTREWYVNGTRVSESDFPRAVTAYLAALATT